MNTIDTTIPFDAITTSTPNRTRTQRRIAIGAAAIVAVVASTAVIHSSGDETARPQAATATQSDDDNLRDLVNRGLIPSQALEPATLADDDNLRDLVNRGLIPAQALDD